ncbi:MAG TPA: ATP synthase F0 subunit B [Acidimicrobiales bacterium]|nr:ATP synthase F0 subunit B [Acidimicrobiales bacterium]
MSVESGTEQPDSDTLLRRVIEIINNGKSVPLSTSVLISSKDEVIELLEAALDRLPDELRQARWMLRERQEYLDKVQREANEILDAARVRAERLVQRTEIVREAQHTAERLVEEARERAMRLRHEAEDYCDQRLAALEIVLQRTMKSVHAGREKLQAAPGPLPIADGPPSELLGEAPGEPAGSGYPGAEGARGSGGGGALFDQDRG